MSGGCGRTIRWLLTCALIISAGSALAAPPATNRTSARPTSAPATQPERKTFRRRVLVMQAHPQPANPIPIPAVVEAAQQKIRDIYATDYADTSFKARGQLALRLIEASDQTKHDLEAKFALLREARDVAANAGEVTTAFIAADHLCVQFPVSKLTERIEVLRMAVPVLSTNQARLAAVSICMDLVDQCVIEGDYDRADALLELAHNLVRQARSVPYLNWVEARDVTVRPYIAAYDTVRPAEATLADAPDDPQANLVMGKFVAFTRGEIDKGLTMLCKGADPQLASLANRDLETPDNPAEQLKTANAWWEMAQSESSDLRSAMRGRAGFWYKRAQPSLDGLDKVMANRRLQELNPPAKPGVKRVHPPDALMLTASPPHWYRVSIAEVTWAAAEQICRDSGGQLGCIETRAEGDLMTKLSRNRMLWLGASVDANGKWSWLSGGNFFFTNWASGEPNNTSVDAHAAIGPDGLWQSVTGKAGFICEWSE